MNYTLNWTLLFLVIVCVAVSRYRDSTLLLSNSSFQKSGIWLQHIVHLKSTGHDL